MPLNKENKRTLLLSIKNSSYYIFAEFGKLGHKAEFLECSAKLKLTLSGILKQSWTD